MDINEKPISKWKNILQNPIISYFIQIETTYKENDELKYYTNKTIKKVKATKIKKELTLFQSKFKDFVMYIKVSYK